jgi:hypothetical protein
MCSKLTIQSRLYHSLHRKQNKIFNTDSYNSYLYAVIFISLSDDDDDDDDGTGLLKNGHICVGTEL